MLTPAQARRRFRVLTLTRWAPVGFSLSTFTLLALQRGLSVAEVLTYATAQGWAVLLLELPTSGIADAIGRRPLLVVAGAINVAAGVLYLRAHTFWQFALAAACMGVYRALGSGPLEAWFVDAVHAAEPDADIGPDLATQGALLGVTIAGGSLASGGLIAWHPLRQWSALVLPLLVFIALAVGHLAATALLVQEAPRRTKGTRVEARRVPTVICDSARLLVRNRVLACLVLVEVFWVTGLTNQESLLWVRMAEVVGSQERAGVWLGPATAAGWGVFAAGSWISGRLARRAGQAPTAAIAPLTHGLAAATMGLAGGPLALIGTYLAANALHGTANPPHAALLHREATSANRATVLSLNSMTAFASTVVVLPLLGQLAQRTSTPTAMVLAGLVSALGAALYRPAVRRERLTAGATGAPRITGAIGPS